MKMSDATRLADLYFAEQCERLGPLDCAKHILPKPSSVSVAVPIAEATFETVRTRSPEAEARMYGFRH